MKTNAARLLDSLGITYRVATYEWDEADLSAAHVATKIGLHPAQVFKTLVASGPGGVAMAVVPGSGALDLKALARLAGQREMQLVPVEKLQSLTGYVRGGVTALAGRRSYPVFVDDAMSGHDVVAVSAGVRGAQLILEPADYIRVTGARVGAIASPMAVS